MIFLAPADRGSPSKGAPRQSPSRPPIKQPLKLDFNITSSINTGGMVLKCVTAGLKRDTTSSKAFRE